MQWYLKVIKNYLGFSGRAHRTEFWMFVLVNLVICIVIGMVEGVLGIRSAETGVGPLTSLYSLAVLLPSIAVAIRRLHDIGRSGWWLLIGFVPVVGGLVLLVFYCLDSVPDNEYGPNPKAA